MPYGGYGIQPWGFQWGDPNSALLGSSVSTPDVHCTSVTNSPAAHNVRAIADNAIRVSLVSAALPTKVGTARVSNSRNPSATCRALVLASTITCE